MLFLYAILVGVIWFAVSWFTKSLILSVLTLLAGVIWLTHRISKSGSN